MVFCPSTDLGTTGDLVQVKVSKKASTDTGTTLSIVRYTQYRYAAQSYLKAVYEHDAIQRILASTSLSSPADILSQADGYGTPSIQNFANKSFTYYSSTVATSSVNTPFGPGENLNSEYGGSDTGEQGFVKTETIGGCGGCGTSGSITKSYFYMDIAHTGIMGTDQNQVVRLVVEDTQDSAGNSISRTVYGLESNGRLLRRAFIQDPLGSPKSWCESWVFATGGKQYRLGEHRMPSAHTGVNTATLLREFLNPYDYPNWANDTASVNSSSGAIYVYTYTTNGVRSDVRAKNGESGTAYYLSAADYGDTTNPYLVTASYDYPTQTTTRSNGKQTSYSYTFYDSSTHQQIKTKTTTLPTISTGQNGSGVATTMGEYYDNLGRLNWTQDGEGYVNYYAYHPVMGTLAYQATDVDPSSVSSEISSGSSGNWEDWTVDGANSNKPTRGGSLPTPLALVVKNFYDAQGRQSQVTDRGGANHYTVYENLRTISFPYWDSTNSKCLVPIQIGAIVNSCVLRSC